MRLLVFTRITSLWTTVVHTVGVLGSIHTISLEINGAEHPSTQVARPCANGFVERFNRPALDGFFRETFRKSFFALLRSLQGCFGQWLHFYSYERPHRDYRNMGRRPVETIEVGKLVREKMQKAVN
jgi:hypothetical protein